MTFGDWMSRPGAVGVADHGRSAPGRRIGGRIGLASSVLVAACLAVAGSAMAHPVIQVISGQTPVESSLDGVTYSTATTYAGYPNATTRADAPPVPAIDVPKLVWYWGAGAYTGQPTGANGPNEAWFRASFTIDPANLSLGGRFFVAADDWMEVLVNGTKAGEYLLADHLQNGQPTVMTVDVGSLLHAGSNTVVFHARDGGGSAAQTASNYFNEWVYFDGSASQPYGLTAANGAAPNPAPEPGTGALAALAGGVALALQRRRLRRG